MRQIQKYFSEKSMKSIDNKLNKQQIVVVVDTIRLQFIP